MANDQPSVLVVGGGSGIGADAARKLAEDGYHVGVMSSSGRGEALGIELGGFGYTGSNLDPAALAVRFSSPARHLGSRPVVVGDERRTASAAKLSTFLACSRRAQTR